MWPFKPSTISQCGTEICACGCDCGCTQVGENECPPTCDPCSSGGAIATTHYCPAGDTSGTAYICYTDCGTTVYACECLGGPGYNSSEEASAHCSSNQATISTAWTNGDGITVDCWSCVDLICCGGAFVSGLGFITVAGTVLTWVTSFEGSEHDSTRDFSVDQTQTEVLTFSTDSSGCHFSSSFSGSGSATWGTSSATGSCDSTGHWISTLTLNIGGPYESTENRDGQTPKDLMNAFTGSYNMPAVTVGDTRTWSGPMPPCSCPSTYTLSDGECVYTG